MCQFIMLDKSLIGKVSERALILYALICDRMKSSKKREQFHDATGKAFVIFTRDEVERTFNVKHCTAAALFSELENAKLIVRTKSSINSACKIYITSEISDAITSEISDANHTNHNHTNHNHLQQKNNENCENQTSFDDIFLEMTTKDAIAKIVAEVVSENSSEFAEITAKIADFVAENVRNAMKNQKVRNIRAYVRACLMHAKTDYDAACGDAGTSSGKYGATYDIALYESYSEADSPEWYD